MSYRASCFWARAGYCYNLHLGHHPNLLSTKTGPVSPSKGHMSKGRPSVACLTLVHECVTIRERHDVISCWTGHKEQPEYSRGLENVCCGSCLL